MKPIIGKIVHFWHLTGVYPLNGNGQASSQKLVAHPAIIVSVEPDKAMVESGDSVKMIDSMQVKLQLFGWTTSNGSLTIPIPFSEEPKHDHWSWMT